MVTPNCPKCGNTSFIHFVYPDYIPNAKIYLICCNVCGAVVGAISVPGVH